MKKVVTNWGIVFFLLLVFISNFIFYVIDVAAVEKYDEWSAIFNPSYYAEHSKGAKEFAGNDKDKLWKYFVNIGIPNKEQGCEEFNVEIYMANYPELVAQFGDIYLQYYIHYAKQGKAQGLNAKSLINSDMDSNSNKANSDREIGKVYTYPEGYIIVGESYAKALETAAGALRTSKTNAIKDFPSAIYTANVGSNTGNVFFVIDAANQGNAFIAADGNGTAKIHAVMNANPGVKHWNIISLQGQNAGNDVVDYITSYNNWITEEFKDANVVVVSQSMSNIAFNNAVKTAMSDRFADMAVDYASLNAKDYKTLFVDLLSKTRQIRVSSYQPNEVGFLILSECHSDILLWSIPWHMDDNTIKTLVPKQNIVPVSAKSHGYPNYFAGGVTVDFEGLEYEADSVINELMKEHPNVKFWYITYFAGSNYIRNIGSEQSLKYAKSNLNTIANKVYYADNTIALMTTPPMYNRGPAHARLVETYDDGEINLMKEMGYLEYSFDTRDGFNKYLSDKTLKKVEFPGYRYGSSGDGLHFYGKQYWIVTADAVNTIYKKTRGEE